MAPEISLEAWQIWILSTQLNQKWYDLFLSAIGKLIAGHRLSPVLSNINLRLLRWTPTSHLMCLKHWFNTAMPTISRVSLSWLRTSQTFHLRFIAFL